MPNSVIPDYDIPGIIFSIGSLGAVPIVLCLFRQYFRSLDFLQMSYFFALTMGPTTFSSKLYTSVVYFNQSFFSSYCTKGDLVCELGFPLSLGIILVGAMILLFIIWLFLRCFRPNLAVEPIYLFLKGFFKWIYLTCIYHSTYALIKAINSEPGYTDSSALISSIIIIAVCGIFPIIQLIGYKLFEDETVPTWRKWMEFFGYVRLASVGVFLGLYNMYKMDTYLHLCMIFIVLYPFIHIWKGEFKYPVIERICFAVGEAIFITNYYLFRYGPSYIDSYDLDFFLLTCIILIDAVFYFVRLIRKICYGSSEGQVDINPEESKNVAVVSSPRLEEKKIKYEHDSG